MILIGQIAMTIGICCNTAAIIMLVRTYCSVQKSSRLLQEQIDRLYMNEIREKINGTGIPSMAEDTEVAE